jgi:predicted nucleic acid-binding protein
MRGVYIETTIPSFMTARPSQDVVIAGKQITTRLWWERRAPKFDLFISPLVIEEAALGDAEAAQRRLRVLDGIRVLGFDAQVGRIARRLVSSGVIPQRAASDASHLAVATRHGMEFLLTWNCTHLANAQALPRVEAVLRDMGFEPPVVCTPDELMEDTDE